MEVNKQASERVSERWHKFLCLLFLLHSYIAQEQVQINKIPQQGTNHTH